MSNKIIKGAIVAAMSAGLVAAASSASAMSHAKSGYKCFGVAKKGKNACGTAKHACAGQATTDYDPKEWVYVKDKKACDKMKAKVADILKKKKKKS